LCLQIANRRWIFFKWSSRSANARGKYPSLELGEWERIGRPFLTLTKFQAPGDAKGESCGGSTSQDVDLGRRRIECVLAYWNTVSVKQLSDRTIEVTDKLGTYLIKVDTMTREAPKCPAANVAEVIAQVAATNFMLKRDIRGRRTRFGACIKERGGSRAGFIG
jgi:hypothetical protein